MVKPKICICCGERIAARDERKPRNPNVCDGCSSLIDGMGEGEANPVLQRAEGEHTQTE